MKIQKSYSLPFPTGIIYEAWISPKTVVAPATKLEIDPIVGGHYRLFIESPEYVSKNEGTFLQVDPGRRLRYTWEWNGDGEVSEIDVTFSAADGGTNVILSHTGFRNEDSVRSHEKGWDGYIEGLQEYLA